MYLHCWVRALAFDSSLITPGMNELLWAQTEAAPHMNCSASWCEQMSQLLCTGAGLGYSLHICPWGRGGVSACCVESPNQPAIWKANGPWPIGPLRLSFSVAEGVTGDHGNIWERRTFQGKVSAPDVDLCAEEITVSVLWFLTSVHRRFWGQGAVWSTTKSRLVGKYCVWV